MRPQKQPRRTSTRAPRTRLSVTLALTTIVGALLCSLLLAHTSAQTGANFTVTNANDAGAGSLRDAITQANVAPEDNTIDFAIPGCAQASPCTTTLTSGELAIANNGTLSINGPGANVLAVSGNNQSRVFNVAQNAVVSISGVTVKSGRASNGIGTSTHGGNGSDGGSIYNNGGTLTLTSCTVSASSSGGGANAGSGGGNGGNLTPGVGGNGGSGGAILNAGTAVLTNATIGNNTTGAGGTGSSAGARGSGGGVSTESGTVSPRNSIIAKNSVGSGGNNPDVLGAFASSGHNFIGKSDGSTGFTDGTNGDQVRGAARSRRRGGGRRLRGERESVGAARHLEQSGVVCLSG